MSQKLINKLHEPGFQSEEPLFQRAVFEAAMARGVIRMRSAPNGNIFFTDPEGKIYHGLV